MGGHHHHHHDHDDEALHAELLDLDGEVLHGYWTDAVALVAAAVSGPVRRVVDLGAGTGVGAVELARRFPDAEVVAVDSSAYMLERIDAKARHLGLAGRVPTVHADLDAGWPDLGAVDVTWASLAMHHLADPDRTLRAVHAATRPGGVLAVAEFGERLRFLPDDLGIGRPGMEERFRDVWAAEAAQAMPHIGADWAMLVTAAGFELVEDRLFAIALDPPLAPSAVRYAEGHLRRMRSALAEQLAPDDLAAVDVLLDGDRPESIRRRDDLRVRGSRALTVARRP